ncbi:MAG: helix-turn-helix domain-containing protein [Chitinophagales bacterium]
MTVREVAGKVGFKKTSYFSALFKTEFGVTPMDVLKEYGFK